MLDIGGSHGLYSAAICRRNPPLRAEVMEVPGVIDAARSAALEFGTTDLVTHSEGDIRHASLGRDYSVVFVGNLIHHLQLEQLPSILDEVWDHLLPGGTIVIWDIAEDREAGDLMSDLFSLFFYLTSTGRCHSQCRIQTALQEAGFDQLRRGAIDKHRAYEAVAGVHKVLLERQEHLLQLRLVGLRVDIVQAVNGEDADHPLRQLAGHVEGNPTAHRVLAPARSADVGLADTGRPS